MLIEQVTDFGRVGTNYFVGANTLASASEIIVSQHWKEYQQFRSKGYTELRVADGRTVKAAMAQSLPTVVKPSHRPTTRRAIRRALGGKS